MDGLKPGGPAGNLHVEYSARIADSLVSERESILRMAHLVPQKPGKR